MSLSDIKRIDQNQRRSRAIVHNGIVYTAGQIPDDMTLDIKGQTLQVLEKIESLIETVSTHKARLLTAQVWLRSLDDLAGFNEAWDSWVVPGHTPTRCCGKVEMNNPKCRVEILVTAAI